MRSAEALKLSSRSSVLVIVISEDRDGGRERLGKSHGTQIVRSFVV